MKGPTTQVPATKSKATLKDFASYVCAGLIQTAFSDEEQFVARLQELDSLSEKEAAQVVKEMRAIQKKIDPLGEWA